MVVFETRVYDRPFLTCHSDLSCRWPFPVCERYRNHEPNALFQKKFLLEGIATRAEIKHREQDGCTYAADSRGPRKPSEWIGTGEDILEERFVT